jgi:hypothetical protein
MSWGKELVILGGVLQVAGVVIVVLQIWETLKRAREYRRRPVSVKARTTGASEAAGGMTVESSREPTIEERLARVEQAVTGARADLNSTKAELRKEWRQELSETVADITADQREENDALVGLVLSVFEGRGMLGKLAQFAGAFLILLGIALATWGSIIPSGS